MKPIVALDLGTTKFCLGLLRPSKLPGTNPIELISIPAAGMKRGMLADFKIAEASLQELVEKAEKSWCIDINAVVTGVAGGHLMSHRLSTSTSLAGQRVTDILLESLKRQAEQQCWAEGREILHISPISFQLDDREPIPNPQGFSGRLLKGDYFVVDGDASYLSDLVRLVNRVGLKVTKLYAETLASASVSVSEEAKETGVVVADIGGGTTDGLVFQRGRPVDAFSLNLGGKMFTNDLAIGLNIKLEEAERMKSIFGIDRQHSATVAQAYSPQGILRDIGGDRVRTILEARCFELTKLIFNQLRPYRRCFGAGLHLTGGGSGLIGLDAFMEDHLKIPVSRVEPSFSPFENGSTNNKETTVDEVNTPHYPARFATCIGLLNLEYGREHSSHVSSKWSGRFLSQFVNWIKELS